MPVPDIPPHPAGAAGSVVVPQARAAGRSTAAVSSRRVGRPAGADTRRSGQASPVLGRGLITAFVGRPTTGWAIGPSRRPPGGRGTEDECRIGAGPHGPGGVRPGSCLPSRYPSTCTRRLAGVGPVRLWGSWCVLRPGTGARLTLPESGSADVTAPARSDPATGTGSMRSARVADASLDRHAVVDGCPTRRVPPVPSPATGSRTVVRPPAAGGVSVRAGLTHAAAYARRAKTRTGSREAEQT